MLKLNHIELIYRKQAQSPKNAFQLLIYTYIHISINTHIHTYIQISTHVCTWMSSETLRTKYIFAILLITNFFPKFQIATLTKKILQENNNNYNSKVIASVKPSQVVCTIKLCEKFCNDIHTNIHMYMHKYIYAM